MSDEKRHSTLDIIGIILWTVVGFLLANVVYLKFFKK